MYDGKLLQTPLIKGVETLKVYTMIQIAPKEMQMDKQKAGYILCLFLWNGTWKGL